MFIIKTILLSLLLLIFVLPNSICIKSSRRIYCLLSPYLHECKIILYEKLEIVNSRLNLQ
ncbi:MAG: hypothetical protein HQL46_04625 [Gammaproteobacteria bacterium]|nr:hypothetical protein [Gammaproteobacteria bacterium]